MARAEIRGAQQIRVNLDRMSRAITPAAVHEAHQRALEPMQDDAKANFTINGSFVSGVIPNEIVILHTSRSESKLTLTGMGAKLGHLIELGTSPHEQPNRGITHPGAAPKPFMRPAFESQADEAIRRAGGVYSDILLRIARTLRI